jgi:hypothetical protein
LYSKTRFVKIKIYGTVLKIWNTKIDRTFRLEF